MSRLAPRFYLSDVGLRKVCTKHRIPMPAQGHWQRVAAGRTVTRMPLPVVPNEQEITFRIAVSAKPKTDEPSVYQAAIDAEAALPPVIVAERLTRPHAITETAREVLRDQRDLRGAARGVVAGIVYVRVHPTSIPRVVRLIDALVKGCEARGFELRQGFNSHRYEGQMGLFIDGFGFSLSVTERMKQEPFQLSPADVAREKRGGYVYKPAYQYTPTGELSIKVEPTLSSRLHGIWTDNRQHLIEERLGDVMLGLRQLAIWRRLDQERDRAREVRHREEVQRCAQLRARVEAEKARVRQLGEEAVAWKRAETIRGFADARAAAGDLVNDPDLLLWLAWARDQADRIDPLRVSPASIIDTSDADMTSPSIWNMPR